MYVQTLKPKVGQAKQQPASPSQTFEVLTVQSTDYKGKKKKQNKKKNVNSGIGPTPNQNTPREGTQETWKFKFPCKIYQRDNLTHQFPFIENFHRMMAQHSGKQKQLIVLIQPFPHQQKQMVVAVSVPQLGGNQDNPPQGSNLPNVNVFMCDHEVNI